MPHSLPKFKNIPLLTSAWISSAISVVLVILMLTTSLFDSAGGAVSVFLISSMMLGYTFMFHRHAYVFNEFDCKTIDNIHIFPSWINIVSIFITIGFVQSIFSGWFMWFIFIVSLKIVVISSWAVKFFFFEHRISWWVSEYEKFHNRSS
jgi:hypothetical protein